jgi:hypothetical protein
LYFLIFLILYAIFCFATALEKNSKSDYGWLMDGQFEIPSNSYQDVIFYLEKIGDPYNLVLELVRV